MGDAAANRGNGLVTQAEKKLKAWSLFGKQSNWETAAELFENAGAQYKIAKQWDEAGHVYVKAAETHEKIGNEHEACQDYVQSAKAFKNSSPKEAVKMFKIACNLHQENNRFSTAGKLWKEVAILEEKSMSVAAAVKAYQQAADCFEAEGSETSGNQMLLKIAELSAAEKDFKRAIEIYEKVSESSIDNNLLKYSVKDYLFKATLCGMVMAAKTGDEDMKDMEDTIDRYKDLNPAYDGSRECKFLEECVKAYQDEDVEAFTNCVFQYDKIYKLDNWTATLLLELKQILKDGGPDSLDGLGGDDAENLGLG